MSCSYSRQVSFESIENFRDLGGYVTQDGHTVAWGKLFRSGNMSSMTRNDLNILKNELGIASVIDLRTKGETERQGTGLISGSGIAYYHVPLTSDNVDREAGKRLYQNLTNMGEFYLHVVRQKESTQRILEALKIIAEPANQPLIFHCSAGKDRTAILAAIVLGMLGVVDEDIVGDYVLSAPHGEMVHQRMKSQPGYSEYVETLPEYVWRADPESMFLFLKTLKQESGSVQQFLKAHGIEFSLVDQLKELFLV